MLKTDIRIIIRRVIIAVVVAMILCFLRDIKVLAAEITPTTNQFDARYTNELASVDSNLPGGYSSWRLYGYGIWQGTINMGNAIMLPDSGYYLSMLSLKYSYTSGNGFIAGNTYNIKIRVNVSDERFPPVAKQRFVLVNAKAGASTSTLENSNILMSSISGFELDPDNDKVFYITYSFVPATNFKYIWFYIGYPEVPYTFTIKSGQSVNNGNVVVRHSGLTYTEGTNAYIQQTTNAVIKQTAELVKVFNVSQEELDYLKDDTDASVDVSGMGSITGLLPAGPLDSLLALPLNVIQYLIIGDGWSQLGLCSDFAPTFTFVFNQTFSLPCFDIFWDEVPNSMMLLFSDFPAALLFLAWAKSVYKRVERAVSFESTVDDEWGGV